MLIAVQFAIPSNMKIFTKKVREEELSPFIAEEVEVQRKKVN